MRTIFKHTTLMAALLVAGCGDETFDFSQFQNAAQQTLPPVAVNDNFAVLGNGQLTGSVTANDTLNGALVSQFQNPGTAGGTVQISANGQLTYTPPNGQSNVVDTFTYTLVNGAGSSLATVTVNVGAQGFFVNNQAVDGGTGSQLQPFNTLAEAVTAATGVNGAAIVVFRGDGTTTGLDTAVTLTGNQTLSGQDPSNPPLLTGPIFLGTNNALTSLNFQGTVPAVVNGTNAVNGTITAVNVTTTGNKAVFLGDATGTWVISNSRFANANLGALDATCSTGTLDWSVLNCTFTNCRVDIVGNLSAGGTAVQTLTVRNNTFNNGNAGEAVGITGASTSTNMTLTVTNNTVNGGGTALRGLDILTLNTCNVTVSCHNNTITGCTSNGISLDAQGSSACAARFNNNQLIGNNLVPPGSSFTASNNGSANLKLALDGNVATSYVIGNVGTTMENLATIEARNTGAFTNSALVEGPCPAP